MTPHRPGPVHRVVSYGPLVDVFVLDMRTYRGPNTPGLEPPGPASAILGAEQLAWLERQLRRSRAVWKVIASDMPIGLIVPDGPVDIEAVANRDPGRPSARELEIAACWRRSSSEASATSCGSRRTCTTPRPTTTTRPVPAFGDFDPFWEFVAGPINAGTFGPNALDTTFGPSAEFVEAALTPNQPPIDGRQYYGVVDADPMRSTSSSRTSPGTTLFSTRLDAAD